MPHNPHPDLKVYPDCPLQRGLSKFSSRLTALDHGELTVINQDKAPESCYRPILGLQSANFWSLDCYRSPANLDLGDPSNPASFDKETARESLANIE